VGVKGVKPPLGLYSTLINKILNFILVISQSLCCSEGLGVLSPFSHLDMVLLLT
jgi:hypothetical protein